MMHFLLFFKICVWKQWVIVFSFWIFFLLLFCFVYTKAHHLAGRSLWQRNTTRFPCLVIDVHVRFTCFTELFTILVFLNLVFTVRRMSLAMCITNGTGEKGHMCMCVFRRRKLGAGWVGWGGGVIAARVHALVTFMNKWEREKKQDKIQDDVFPDGLLCTRIHLGGGVGMWSVEYVYAC